MKKFVALTAMLIAAVMLMTSCGGDSPSASSESTSKTTATAGQTAGSSPTVAASDDTDVTPSPSSGNQGSERIEVSAGTRLVDFEKGFENISFFDLSNYGYMQPVLVEASGEDAQSGKALRFDIDYANSYGVISMQIADGAGDIIQGFSKAADYDYMRFWVSNQGDSDVSIAVVLVVGDAVKSGCLDPKGAKMLTAEGEEEVCYSSDAADVDKNNGTGDTSLIIPFGFTGWVYYPLKEQVKWWEGTTVAPEELSSVSSISMDIRFTDATMTEYLVIDDICLAGLEE